MFEVRHILTILKAVYGRDGFLIQKNTIGGNKFINYLLLERPDAYKNFKCSILRVFERFN